MTEKRKFKARMIVGAGYSNCPGLAERIVDEDMTIGNLWDELYSDALKNVDTIRLTCDTSMTYEHWVAYS